MSTNLPFSDLVRVRFSDTDAQGHLYFANYLVYADEVVGHYMEELGFSAMNPGEAPCFIFTVNLNCSYLDECKAFDTVRVCVGYSRLGNSSADVSFELYNDASGTLLARGSFTQVFTDKQTRKSTPIPEAFRQAIIVRQQGAGDRGGAA
ncbi:MAG: acyl-CoA thioesterase [Halieaceae bacterium]|nr:acyl-CoA thioesterase [Halieaceae bacterium]MCP5166196.1 acyl-CoA thioesterase [Pseudomonadales bacterium]MCP5187122.1 acyl-CoA thioesterase [Pseudomonadales bacterium]